MSRKTTAKVVFDGVDISEDIAKYLTSLTYTDNEEGEADDLQIKLQDKDDKWLCDWLIQTVVQDTGEAKTTSTSETAVASTSSGASYTVNAKSGLNMRTGPGTDYSKVGALAYGTAVTVTGSTGEWSTVDYNGQTVYMYTNYLTPAAGGSDASQYPTLKFGSQGEAVKTMQTALIAKGQSLPKYGVDGYFGSETQAAVSAFQTANGLTVDGVCGTQTWTKLLGSDSSGSSAENAQKKGFKISATINREGWTDGHSNVLECGQFELDAIDASGPPSTVTIKATSLPYTAQIRQTKKSRAWENYKLSGIAQEMAGTAGMTCMYESSYDPVYDHVEQYEESDITFLSRMSHDAGISVKCSNNIIILFDQRTFEKLGSVMTIDRNDSSCYEKYKLSTDEADTQYESCRVRYTAPDGSVIEAIAKVEDYDEESKNNQQLEYWARVTSIGEAQALAEMRLRLHNKYSRTASFTLPGNPDLVAGVCVDLSGFGLWDGKYIIEQAKHTLSSGYTTQISLRNVLEDY